jgi:hypothetical protein
MARLLVALAWVPLALACASMPPPPATGAPDWASLGDEKVPQLVTHDADGDERITKLWISVVDGRAYLRTGGSRWNANLEREPRAELWIGEHAYPVGVTRVEDSDLRVRIEAGFREKYGFGDKLISPFRSSEPNLWRLDPAASP